MSGTVTLEKLIERVRDRANMKNSSFVTDDVITNYLNDAISELYDLIINHRGEQFFESDTTISVINGTDAYSLPSDFYKIVSVELNDGCPVDTFDRRDVYYKSHGLRYCLSGNQLKLNNDNYSCTLKVFYIPLTPELSDPADTTDFYNGWEKYAIWKAAKECLDKEESDTSTLDLSIQRYEAKIARSSDKNTHKPKRIKDTQGKLRDAIREVY